MSLSAKGFCLPSSDSSIINLNHSENDDIQKEIKAEIETKVKANTHLSETMDEYTSVHCGIHEHQCSLPKRCYKFGFYDND